MNRPATYDRHSFLIDGRRRFLLIGTVSYFRIPRADWRERLLLLRDCGFNTVDVYVPWNYHEPEPGRFDFGTGNRDLAAYLALCGELGLMVYLRPGPYICNEWDGGGLPAWLYTMPEVRLRQNEPNYLRHVRRYLGRVNALVRPLLATNGGPVVLYQLENELDFYPCDDVAGYIRALRDMAREDGIDVPMTACVGLRTPVMRAMGGVDGVLPTPNVYSHGLVESEATAAREAVAAAHYEGGGTMADVPPFVTEMNRDEESLRRVLSAGFKGLGPFNFSGGAHPGYWNGVNNWNDMTLVSTTVDFGGMVLYDGRVGPAFGGARRLAGFVAAFEEALCRSAPTSSWDGGPAASNPAIGAREAEDRPGRVYSLLDGDTAFVFLLNPTDAPQETRVTVGELTFPRHEPLTVAPGRDHIVVANVPLHGAGVPAVLRYCTGEVVALEAGPEGATLRLAGDPATRAELCIEAEPGAVVTAPTGAVEGGPDGTTLVVTFGESRDEVVAVGGMTLIVSSRTRDEVGRAGVDRVRVLGQRRDLLTEERREAPWAVAVPPDAVQWQGAGRAMEALGALHGAAWYEFAFDTRGGLGPLTLPHAGDLVTAYLDDAYLGTWVVDGGQLELCAGVSLVPGRHTLRMRAEIWGHTNFHDTRWPSTHLGSLRGIWGTPILGGEPLGGAWRFWREPLPVAAIGRGADVQRVTGPVQVLAGASVIAQVAMPVLQGPGGVLSIEGMCCHGEAWAGGELVGRFVFGPVPHANLTGGPPNRFYVPADLVANDGTLLLVVRGAGTGGRVTGLAWEELSVRRVNDEAAGGTAEWGSLA